MSESHTTIKTIMVVKLRTLGDVLTTFPLLRALKELHPRAKLIMVADETYKDLFSTHLRVDEFWEHPVRRLKTAGPLEALRQNLGVIGDIRRRRVDLYIDLYGSLRTAMWGALAGVPQRLGFNLRGRKYFYTQRIVAQHRYVVDLNLQFARELGWTGTDNSLEFFLDPADQSAALSHLHAHGWKKNQPLLVVSPGGGWPLKCWSAERFGALAQRLVRGTGCRVVISGAPAEQALIDACGRALDGDYIPAVGLPLRQLAAVIALSRMFVGNDSGPKYFAEAFRVPTLICYGPTDFRNNNPDSPRHPVAGLELDCRPCHSEICRQDRRICLDDLSVEAVYNSARELWNQTPPEGRP
jgi:ADP-heptose:LPS heptosyltransferase